MDRIVEGKTCKITVTNTASGQIKELIHSVAENNTVPGASSNKFWENIRLYITYRLHWKVADVEFKIAEYSEEAREAKSKRNKKRMRNIMCNNLDF